MTDDIFFATIPDLNARLKKREFSAVELTEAQGRDLALNRDAAGLAARMAQAGWSWGPSPWRWSAIPRVQLARFI